MNSHKMVFETCMVIALHHVHLGDNNVVETIGMSFIVVGVLFLGKIKGL